MKIKIFSSLSGVDKKPITDDEEDDRNLVNIDLNKSNNGGLAFSVDLYQPVNKSAYKPMIYERKPKTDSVATSMSTTSTEYTTETDRTQKTPKSGMTEMSLGAKIQKKATTMDHQYKNVLSNRTSVLSDSKDSKVMASTTGSISSSLSSNRTLYLRQQSAKAKRESFNISQQAAGVNQMSRRSLTANNAKPHQSQNLNSTRSASPLVIMQHQQQQQSVLNSNNLQHAAAKDSFLRRKNYDPAKAVEGDKIKRQQKQKSGSRGIQNSDEDVEQTISSSNIDLRSQINNNNEDGQVLRNFFSSFFLSLWLYFCC